MNNDMIKARKQYEQFLASLDPKLRYAMRQYINDVQSKLSSKKINLNEAVTALKDKITTIVENGTQIGLDTAKTYKAAEFTPFISEVNKIIDKENLSIDTLSLNEITPVFGGGLDKKLINDVWDKVWPDKLTVDDRLTLLTNKIKTQTESIIKQGIADGSSAKNIAKDLSDALDIPRNAAFRLAATTTNQVYQITQAEISIQASFVMGIRVIRGMYGKASDDCDICEEHGGPADGEGIEYMKDDFGGRSYDLYVMANAPAYHCNCNCGIEDIMEDAQTFIANARAENSQDV